LKPAAHRGRAKVRHGRARIAGSHGGQAMIEYLIIFPILIVLLFGVIQWALIYQARSVVNNATLLAARAAAMNNGNFRAARKAFGAGLAPLFNTEASDVEYLKAVEKGYVDAGVFLPNGLTTIKIINPTQDAFTDFERPKLDGSGGTEIPNDTLQYRSTGPGTQSKISIQDANILHMRVTYCYRMYVPIVNNVISAVANTLSSWDYELQEHGMSDQIGIGTGEFSVPWNDTCNLFMTKREPRIKIMSEAVVRMQSPYFRENLP
jgi:hypothetical protein